MVDYTKQTGTQLDAMIAVDPDGIGAEWTHLVSHVMADWNAGIVDKTKWPTLASKVESTAAEVLAGLTGYSTATGGDGSGIVATVNLVAAAHTSSGAAQAIQGLVGEGIAAGGAQISDIATNAAKKLVGSVLSDAAGVVQDVGGALTCTGVGAAVGIGVSVIAGVFGKLFGSPPPPPYSVGNCGLDTKPTIVSKYGWTYGQIVDGGPGSPDWRRFPDRANKEDAVWFAPHSPARRSDGFTPLLVEPYSFWWSGKRRPHNDLWYCCYSYPNDTGTRPIDHILYDNGHDGAYGADGQDPGGEFSLYRQLEQEMLAASIVGIAPAQLKSFRRFQEAFFKAWKQNREFGLNGCKTQPDWKVLQKTAAMWNQANGPQSTMHVAPRDNVPLLPFNPKVAPSKAMSSYVHYLLSRYNSSFTMALDNGGGFTLNTGKVSDVSVGGLLPAGSVHLLALHAAKTPAAIPHLKAIGVSPASIAQLQAHQAKHAVKPKRRWFFGVTLAGAAAGAAAGGPVGAIAGAGAGAAIDYVRMKHAEK